MALAYSVSGAFFISQANDKAKEVEVDAKPAPAIVRPGSALNKHSLGVGIGQTFLYSQFEDNGQDEITVDLYYNYSASHSFDLLLNAHLSSHEFGETESDLFGFAIGIKSKFYNIDNFTPFAVAGLGFYSPTVVREVEGKLVESTSHLVFGVNLGAGGELKLNEKYSIGLMAHYHDPFDVKQEVGPKVEGNYIKLLITSFYTF